MPSTPDDRTVVLDVKDDWIGRYEDLRHRALSAQSSGGGWALALLVRSGLVAWMRAWPPSRHVKRNSALGADQKPSLPAGLVGQMATIVTNIILDKPAEVLA